MISAILFRCEVQIMQEMTQNFTHDLRVFYKENHEKCTNCSKPFTTGDTAHLGYLTDRRHAVLCDACSKLLAETVVRYYWMGDGFIKPNPNDKLWRYMDLAKLVSLINTSSLFFSAASSFDDPFEGAKGVIERKEKWNNFYMDFFKKAIVSAPGQNLSDLTAEKIEGDAKRLLSDMEASGVNSRDNTYISCWYGNEYESEAMWKLYSKNVSNAVAIQTTAEHLYLSLGRSPYIDIGKIQYIDYHKQYANINSAYWFKRKAFEHEHEVRALITSFGEKEKGKAIKVDTDILIDQIYISPYASSWFEDVVQSIIEKYEIKAPIQHSTMDEHPFY